MNMNDVAIAFYYSKETRYSVHALLSAIDISDLNVDVYLISEDDLVLNKVFALTRMYKVVVFGFTLFTTSLHKLLWITKFLTKSKPKNLLLIAGGPYATGDPVGALTLGFDIVFVGESERSLTEFLREVIERGDPLRIQGIAYREDGDFFFNGKPEPIDLNKYPPFPYWRRKFNPIEITRGCPFQCGYCQTPYIHGFILRHRNVENVTKYAEIFWKHGLRDLRFITPNALAYGSLNGIRPNVNALVELLSSLRVLKERYGGRVFMGSFPSEVRPEFLNYDLAKLLKEHVDNRRIIIGAQSGSKKILRLLRRGHTVDDVLEAVEAALKVGFKVDVDFIFGLPGENEEDVEETLKLMEKLVRMGARIHAHTFIPLPGSPLENAPPGKIPLKIKKYLMKIYGKGKLYGDWLKQERIAEIVHELRVKGVIRTKERWKLKIGRGYNVRLVTYQYI